MQTADNNHRIHMMDGIIAKRHITSHFERHSSLLRITNPLFFTCEKKWLQTGTTLRTGLFTLVVLLPSLLVLACSHKVQQLDERVKNKNIDIKKNSSF